MAKAYGFAKGRRGAVSINLDEPERELLRSLARQIEEFVAPDPLDPDADPLAALVGTMGGDSQPQVLLQIITRLLRHGATPAAAVGADRWVLRGGADAGFDTWDDVTAQEVVVEGRRHPAWVDGLTARGHDVVTEAPGTRFGHAHVITATPTGWAGASDPRAETGSASGF